VGAKYPDHGALFGLKRTRRQKTDESGNNEIAGFTTWGEVGRLFAWRSLNRAAKRAEPLGATLGQEEGSPVRWLVGCVNKNLSSFDQYLPVKGIWAENTGKHVERITHWAGRLS